MNLENADHWAQIIMCIIMIFGLISWKSNFIKLIVKLTCIVIFWRILNKFKFWKSMYKSSILPYSDNWKVNCDLNDTIYKKKKEKVMNEYRNISKNSF